MRDIGNEETDALLENMERKVAKVYRRAARESQEKLRDYLDRFEKADKKALADVKAGKMTEEAYKKWRKDEMLKGKRWEEMLNTLAEDYVNADKIAMSIVNGYTPEAYAINRNFAAFEVEKGALIDTSFTLYNRQTVERLLREHKDMLPKPRVDIPKDRRWNKRHIRAEITQGVLQGESIPKVAKRLQKVVGMDYAVAVRNARTAITGAQNAGRMDQYKAAHDKGIDMMQKWVATLDGRTRDSHAALDGELINVGGTFSNGLRFPGDPLGEPGEVYNCRCRMVGHLIGYSFSNDDVERDDRLGGMSYEEWKKSHEEQIVKVESGTESKRIVNPFENEMETKGYVGLSGPESDEFIETYHNKSLLVRNHMNTMQGEQSRQINRALRKGMKIEDEKDLKMVEKLDKAITKNELPQDMTLFRGVSVSEFRDTKVFEGFSHANVPMDLFKLADGKIDYDAWGKAFESAQNAELSDLLTRGRGLVGMVVEDKGFMQLSASSQRNIFGFSDINLQLHAPKGLNAYISDYKEESEIILGRGTKYEILGAEISEYVASNGNRKKVLQLIARVIR